MSFQKVFLKETEFEPTPGTENKSEMREIQVNKKDIKLLLNKLYKGKAMGPGDISQHILKEYRHQPRGSN